MRARFSHIRDHLRNHGVARELLERNSRERDVASALRASLPAALEPHCIGIGLVDDKVTLFLDSAAWSTRARFLSEEIRASLSGFRINELIFQVRPPNRTDDGGGQSRVASTHRLSEAVVKHLFEAASHQTDPMLSDALKRLARHHARDDASDPA